MFIQQLRSLRQLVFENLLTSVQEESDRQEYLAGLLTRERKLATEVCSGGRGDEDDDDDDDVVVVVVAAGHGGGGGRGGAHDDDDGIFGWSVDARAQVGHRGVCLCRDDGGGGDNDDDDDGDDDV